MGVAASVAASGRPAPPTRNRPGNRRLPPGRRPALATWSPSKRLFSPPPFALGQALPTHPPDGRNSWVAVVGTLVHKFNPFTDSSLALLSSSSSSSSSSAYSFFNPAIPIHLMDGRDERRAPFFFFFSSFSLRVFLAILARAECVRWPQGLFGRTKGRKEGKLTHKPATWKTDSNLGGLVVIQSRRRGQAHPGRRRRAETDGNGDEGSKDPLDRPTDRPAA